MRFNAPHINDVTIYEDIQEKKNEEQRSVEKEVKTSKKPVAKNEKNRN